MLYELIAVARPGNVTEVREIARSTGLQILRSGGVIRSVTNWGPLRLPKPTTKHQTRYDQGHYFLMRFDASSAAQNTVRRILGLDPRMIRFSVVKLAEKLEDVKGFPAEEKWNEEKEKSMLNTLGRANRGATGSMVFENMLGLGL